MLIPGQKIPTINWKSLSRCHKPSVINHSKVSTVYFQHQQVFNTVGNVLFMNTEVYIVLIRYAGLISHCCLYITFSCKYKIETVSNIRLLWWVERKKIVDSKFSIKYIFTVLYYINDNWKQRNQIICYHIDNVVH